MSNITIVDLEVFWRVGITDEERSQPQRLLLSVDMVFDISAAADSDRMSKSIDYMAVADTMLKFGENRDWKLIERIATHLGTLLLSKFHPREILVEVKKFPIPQARYVSVIWTNHSKA